MLQWSNVQHCKSFGSSIAHSPYQRTASSFDIRLMSWISKSASTLANGRNFCFPDVICLAYRNIQRAPLCYWSGCSLLAAARFSTDADSKEVWRLPHQNMRPLRYPCGIQNRWIDKAASTSALSSAQLRFGQNGDSHWLLLLLRLQTGSGGWIRRRTSGITAINQRTWRE